MDRREFNGDIYKPLYVLKPDENGGNTRCINHSRYWLSSLQFSFDGDIGKFVRHRNKSE